MVAEIQQSNTLPLHLSRSNEWYTPLVYINAARKVMGTIDLDPASCSIANRIVRASRYYSIEDDGLSKEWRGKCWLNPPYGRDGVTRQKGTVSLWIQRLIEQYEQNITTEAILLVNATTEKRWFDPLWSYPICFASVRISFYSPSGDYGRPPHANALVYFGKNESAFAQVFNAIGPIVKRVYVPTVTAPCSLWEAKREPSS